MFEDDKPPEPAYEVGYGKPPRHTRFQKGVSGNPKGRVKGSRNYRTDVTQMLKAPVKVNQNGKRKTLTTQQAYLIKVAALALNGNIRAIQKVDELARLVDSAANQQAATALVTDEGDRAIMEGFLARAFPSIVASTNEVKSATESEQPQSEVQPEKPME